MGRLALDLRDMDRADLARTELKQLVQYMANTADQLDDKSIAYGAYATMAIRDKAAIPLKNSLLMAYRKRMVEWFEYALLKRARLGGGGTLIKKVEHGLAAFVKALPEALISKHVPKVSDFLPEQEYLNRQKLDPVGAKIFATLRSDLHAVGKTASISLPVEWDAAKQVWFIPPKAPTFDYKNMLGNRGYKFQWHLEDKRWERKTLSPEIQRDFDVRGQAKAPPKPVFVKPLDPVSVDSGSADPDPVAIKKWFYQTWLPKNIQRFTKVFSEYVRNLESSYAIIFSVSGTEPEVKFQRNIHTVAQAVEELRYRYINRQGREPWLEVLNKFTDLVRSSDPATVEKLIDRINDLQHSNGLFMEHFPKSVQSWYSGFLNAKYFAPGVVDLAKYIPDTDLQDLIMGLDAPAWQPVSGHAEPGEWHTMEKEMAEIGKLIQINWREKGYPQVPGTKRPGRFDPEVQSGLSTLKQLDNDRQKLLAIPQIEHDKDWAAKAKAVLVEIKQTLANVEDATRKYDAEAKIERLERLDPTEWMREHHPAQFAKDFPNYEKSEVARFRARYAKLAARVAARWAAKVASSTIV